MVSWSLREGEGLRKGPGASRGPSSGGAWEDEAGGGGFLGTEAGPEGGRRGMEAEAVKAGGERNEMVAGGALGARRAGPVWADARARREGRWGVQKWGSSGRGI